MTPGNQLGLGRPAVKEAAARALGVNPESPPGEIRAAFLRAVGNDNFMPGPYVRDAFDILCGSPSLSCGSPLLEEVYWNEDERLRTAVEGFAGDFFDTPISQRTERWEALCTECASSPGLVARLNRLEPGLGLDVATISDRSAEVMRLARIACELFVLAPKPRAIRRQQHLAQLGRGTLSSLHAWAPAARRLQSRHPHVAALAPELLTPLLERPSRRRRGRRPPLQPAAAGVNSTRSNNSWWKYLVIIVIVSNAARGLNHLFITPRTSAPPPVAVPNPGTIPTYWVDAPNLRTIPDPTRQQIDAFLKSRFRDEVANHRSKPFADDELEELYVRVFKTRNLAGDPVKRRLAAIEQLKRELLSHGLLLDEQRLSALYDRFFEPKGCPGRDPRRRIDRGSGGAADLPAGTRQAMSNHELPADLTRWPTDPYRLLGVVFGTSARDLRRAYLGLVRKFKPEHFPDHFRRIREAYEIILSHSESTETIWLPSAAPTQAPDEAREAEQSDGVDSSATPPEHTASSHLTPESLPPEEIWELACGGREDEAYRALVKRHERNPRNQDIILQLYWLMIALPELDPSRSAFDWLVKGIRAMPTAGSLLVLYRRTILADPSEALSINCTQLFRQGARIEVVLALAEWRWRAARGLERWKIITVDLQCLRVQGLSAHDAAWAQLLLSAAAQLAWGDADSRAEARRLVAEIEALHLLDLALEQGLSQLDFQLDVAAGLDALAQTRRTNMIMLAELVPLSWNNEPAAYRQQLTALVAEVANDPCKALDTFDRVRVKAPSVLGYLVRLIGDLAEQSARVRDPRTPADIVQACAGFINDSKWWTYASFRGPLLRFCLAEALAPDALAGAIAPLAGFAITAEKHLANEIEADWPLRLVYSAWELF